MADNTSVNLSDPKGAQTSAGGAPAGGQTTKPGGEGAANTGDSNKGQSQSGNGEVKHPETGAPITHAELADYYKQKFADSTSGAQSLLKDKEALAKQLGEKEASQAALAKELEEIRKVAEGKNPEGLSLHDLQKNLTSTTNELALLKENSLLDNFLDKTKIEGASNLKEALRTLARANPKTDIGELWDKNLKATAEKSAADALAKRTSQQKGASDNGEGTSTGDPAGGGGSADLGGYTLDQFNKLPLPQRKEILLKSGGQV